MTLNELKLLHEEYIQLQWKKIQINRNDDLSRNQMKKEIAKISPRLEEIESIFKKYNSTFVVNAQFLARNICDVLSHNISESEVSFQHACIGKWYEKEYFEGWEKYYQGEKCLRIYINSLGKTEKLRLFRQPVSKDYTFDTDYIIGNYNLNTYDLLLNINTKYSQLFHKACWLTIEESLKAKNSDLKHNADVNKKLILKKIEELQLKAATMQNTTKKISNNKTTVFTDEQIEEIKKI